MATPPKTSGNWNTSLDDDKEEVVVHPDDDLCFNSPISVKVTSGDEGWDWHEGDWVWYPLDGLPGLGLELPEEPAYRITPPPPAEVNDYGQWTAFIQSFANQCPLKALYNTARHSPVHPHIHTPTAESTTQGDSQLVSSSQGEGVSLRDTSTIYEEPGIEPATFRVTIVLWNYGTTAFNPPFTS